MNCFESFAKYILFIFNLIFLIFGILLIVLGSLMFRQFKSIDEAFNNKTLPVVLIILGCVIFVISFLGCCGAIRESVICSSIYAIFMFILFCLQVALVVWIFVKRTEFLKTMSKSVQTTWDENDKAHGFPMDGLQLSLDCCGVHGYMDYVKKNLTVPKSCCSVKVGECPEAVYSSRPGCQIKFVNFWENNMNVIRWGGIGVAVVEFIAMAFAACVIFGIRRSDSQGFLRRA